MILTFQSTFFGHVRMGPAGLNQYQAADKVSYSRTQHSDSAGASSGLILIAFTWVKVQNFPNPEFHKFDSKNLRYVYKTSTISVLNSQLPFDELKIIQRNYHNLPIRN